MIEGRDGRDGRDEAVETVSFTLGKRRFLAARAEVRAFRHSPRVRHARHGRLFATELPVVSLSDVLELGRDTSTDRRVLEVVHEGEPLGLEVTTILGVLPLPRRRLRALPPLVRRNALSSALLGLAWIDERWALAIDLPTLLVERAVRPPRGDEDQVLPSGAVDASSLPDGPPIDPFA